MYVQMHVHKIVSLCIAVDTYVYLLKRRVQACSKHDILTRNLMNTLVFVNFLVVKIFPTLIRQYFPQSKFCAIRSVHNIFVVNDRPNLMTVWSSLVHKE